ncbi:hypothetical protein AK830_g4996 [Neonectria ditissima]|uniref:Uncharacterized protein n=1 Tax=Neonectria ditissima TaxID=78410 RepID=A0A0P7BMM2_9HYPO|nr:hypothetical protein AK830_g4996 [Neonectria ditissima]
MSNIPRTEYILDDLKFNEGLGFTLMWGRPCLQCVENVCDMPISWHICTHGQSPQSYLPEGSTLVGVKIPDVLLGPAQLFWNSMRQSKEILNNITDPATSERYRDVDCGVKRALAAWKALVQSVYSSADTEREAGRLTHSLQLQETASIRAILITMLLVKVNLPVEQTRRYSAKIIPAYVKYGTHIEEFRAAIYHLEKTVREV